MAPARRVGGVDAGPGLIDMGQAAEVGADTAHRQVLVAVAQLDATAVDHAEEPSAGGVLVADAVGGHGREPEHHRRVGTRDPVAAGAGADLDVAPQRHMHAHGRRVQLVDADAGVLGRVEGEDLGHQRADRGGHVQPRGVDGGVDALVAEDVARAVPVDQGHAERVEDGLGRRHVDPAGADAEALEVARLTDVQRPARAEGSGGGQHR